MVVSAVRTLPDGTAAESREGPSGSGWFGVTPEGERGRRLVLGFGVTVLVDGSGHVVSVAKERGKVTDSVLFYALRTLTLNQT